MPNDVNTPAGGEGAAGMSALMIMYGQVSELKTELRNLKDTTAPLARVKEAEDRLDSMEEKVRSALAEREAESAQREVERKEAVDLLKNKNDNKTKLLVQVVIAIAAVFGAWAAAGFPVPW